MSITFWEKAKPKSPKTRLIGEEAYTPRTTEYTVFQAQNPREQRRKARRQDSPLEEVTKAGRAINASL